MKRYTTQEQQDYLTKWRQSGESIKKFCGDKQINLTTFYTWKKKHSQEKPLFVEVPMRSIKRISSSILLQKGSYSIKIEDDFNAETLKEILLILGELHD